MHIMPSADTWPEAGAFVCIDQVSEQIRIINVAFNGSGVRFSLPKSLRGRPSLKPIVDRVKLTVRCCFPAVSKFAPQPGL